VPNIIRYFTDPHIVFFVALAGSAFIFRTRNKLESLLIYTAILLITSPIITNQYLAIVIPFIATRCNWLFLVYTLMATWHLLIDGIGLHIDYLIIRTPKGLITYNMMIIVLTLGFLWYYGLEKVGRAVINEVKIQLGWEE